MASGPTTSLTVIYQIDAGCRRLLWIGKRCSEREDASSGAEGIGPGVCCAKDCALYAAICGNPIWKVIADQAGQALHVLDRFHITLHLNQAVDEVRRTESTTSQSRKSKDQAQRLKNMPLVLVAQRKPSGADMPARSSTPCWQANWRRPGQHGNWKEVFPHFCKYKSTLWASAFLDYWRQRAMRSRLEPIKKVARMLRAHEGI